LLYLIIFCISKLIIVIFGLSESKNFKIENDLSQSTETNGANCALYLKLKVLSDIKEGKSGLLDRDSSSLFRGSPSKLILASFIISHCSV
jgi:hypothetical protein